MTSKGSLVPYNAGDFTPPSFSIPQPLGRSLYFTKQVDQTSIAELSQRIIEINEADRFLERVYPVIGQTYRPAPIKIYIDSYGGHVYQCFGLLSLMDCSVTPIHTIVTGTAMSCGFMIAIHGHRRFCYENSTLMYHQVSSGAIGEVRHMEERMEESKRLQTMIEEMTLRRTRMTPELLESVYRSKKDLYLHADDALKYACVDDVIRSTRAPFADPNKPAAATVAEGAVSATKVATESFVVAATTPVSAFDTAPVLDKKVVKKKTVKRKAAPKAVRKKITPAERKSKSFY